MTVSKKSCKYTKTVVETNVEHICKNWLYAKRSNRVGYIQKILNESKQNYKYLKKVGHMQRNVTYIQKKLNIPEKYYFILFLSPLCALEVFITFPMILFCL